MRLGDRLEILQRLRVIALLQELAAAFELIASNFLIRRLTLSERRRGKQRDAANNEEFHGMGLGTFECNCLLFTGRHGDALAVALAFRTF